MENTTYPPQDPMSMNKAAEAGVPPPDYPHQGTQDKDWDQGLCGCGLKEFCVACWCPCIQYGRNQSRFKALRDTGVPHPQGGEGCGQDGVLHCALTCVVGAGWILQFIARGDYRTRYGIKGSTIADCLTACCCSPCELSQESHQIRLEEQARANVVHDAPPAPQAPMSY
ncbi:hypothetical protein BT69DRAFT_1250045 [Atractiella rhizophila]|nr:hypothetical protein BT69DRAFT_1250045 [Atractiella rhizophila]